MVLLYTLIHKFKHPIYDGKMPTDNFVEKLKNPTIHFDKIQCSQMAMSLIKKIQEPKASLRYSAHEILRHPWITGNDDGEIPLSAFDLYLKFETSNNLKVVCKQLTFLVKIRNISLFY